MALSMEGGYYSMVLDYKYVPYAKPSADFLWTFYFYKGLFKYRCELLGDFSFWTESQKSRGCPDAESRRQEIFPYGEPQFWVR
jgi:hypothetical protein